MLTLVKTRTCNQPHLPFKLPRFLIVGYWFFCGLLSTNTDTDTLTPTDRLNSVSAAHCFWKTSTSPLLFLGGSSCEGKLSIISSLKQTGHVPAHSWAAGRSSPPSWDRSRAHAFPSSPSSPSELNNNAVTFCSQAATHKLKGKGKCCGHSPLSAGLKSS